MQPGDPPPLCMCGCGTPVKVSKDNYRQYSTHKRSMAKGQPYNYVRGHNPVNRKNTWELAQKKYRDAEFMPVEHFTRLVEEFCQRNGYNILQAARSLGLHPMSLRRKKHIKWVTRTKYNRVKQAMETNHHPVKSPYVPAQPIRKALRQYQAQHSLSMRELSERMGISYYTMRGILERRERTSVSRPIAERLLRRMAGQSTLLTPLEQRRVAAEMARVRQAERELAS